MTKKIAQLTKVIIQLNTRIEDNDIDKRQLAVSYEDQIDSIVRDANDRIAAATKERDDAKAKCVESDEVRENIGKEQRLEIETTLAAKDKELLLAQTEVCRRSPALPNPLVSS